MTQGPQINRECIGASHVKIPLLSLRVRRFALRALGEFVKDLAVAEEDSNQRLFQASRAVCSTGGTRVPFPGGFRY